MPQELPTWRYFRRLGIGAAAARPAAVRDFVRHWIARPEAHRQLRERMSGARDPQTPEAHLRLLLEKT